MSCVIVATEGAEDLEPAMEHKASDEALEADVAKHERESDEALQANE